MLQALLFERLVQHAPVILIGMHRSGTSLLCRLLGQLGLHLGHDQDRLNAESQHFQRLNKRMLRAAGAFWNDPAPFIAAQQNPAFVAEWSAYLQSNVFAGISGARYWGFRRWVALRGGGALPPWGWKDPRTSLTLGIWLRILPDAQVVRIIRNGIDVAISLHRRQLAQTRRWRIHPDHRDPRGFDVRFSFGLWEQYEQHLQTYQDCVTRYTQIRYEDLLREPEQTLRALVTMIGIDPAEARIAAAAATVNPPRADNWDGYQDFAHEFLDSPMMRALGYAEGEP